MKIFGYNTNGCIYIETDRYEIICRQTDSDNNEQTFGHLMMFNSLDEAADMYARMEWRKERARRLTGIDRNFQEDMINDMEMGV